MPKKAKATEPTEAELQKRREAARKRAATRAANQAVREAEEAREAAQRAREEIARAKAMEAEAYDRYEAALKQAMAAKGSDFAVAWRKADEAQRACVNVSARARMKTAA